MGAGGEVVTEQRKSVDEWILKRFILRKRRNIERDRERERERERAKQSLTVLQTKDFYSI